MSLPYLTKLIKKLAPKVGARVIVEPEWGIVAQIIYKNGVVRSLRNYSVDLNSIASADIAKDKDYAKFFMKKLGYPVAEGRTFFSKEWGEAIKKSRGVSHAFKYAKKLRYPVIAKPKSQSQGTKVVLAHGKEDLKRALKNIFKIDRVAIVERYQPGRDYRIVVLDREVISAYERISLSVVGDGKSSIMKLLRAKQRDFIKKGRDTKINFSDPRIKNKLKKQNLKYSSILQKTETVFLLDNANLSTGGDSVDVTKTMHPDFKKIAIELTKKMGLRMAGVDLMIQKGNIIGNPKTSKYYVIEINAAPGLDHYVTTGPAQKKVVEAMYLKILKALARK
ncbi:MAG: cyanophycin synthetase [Patescibacteria group bacterium]